MSQNMYGVQAQVYAPLGGGVYIADPVTGLITAVADGDVGQMIRMGCLGSAIAIAAGALSSVTAVDTRTGAVVLGHGDVAGLSIAHGDVSGLGTAALLNLAAAFNKHAVVAGGAAGNITVTGIKTTDTLAAVLRLVGAATTLTNITDLTSEFTITATSTINNTGGTATTADKLLVLWTAAS